MKRKIWEARKVGKFIYNFTGECTLLHSTHDGSSTVDVRSSTAGNKRRHVNVRLECCANKRLNSLAACLLVDNWNHNSVSRAALLRCTQAGMGRERNGSLGWLENGRQWRRCLGVYTKLSRQLVTVTNPYFGGSRLMGVVTVHLTVP